MCGSDRGNRLLTFLLLTVQSIIKTRSTSAAAAKQAVEIRPPTGHTGALVGTATLAKQTYRVVIKSTVTNITWSSKLLDKKSPEFAAAIKIYCDGWKLQELTDYKACTVNSFPQISSSRRRKRNTGSVKV